MNKPIGGREQNVVLPCGTNDYITGCMVVQWEPDKISEEALDQEEFSGDITAILGECVPPSPKGRCLRIESLVELFEAIEKNEPIHYWSKESEVGRIFDQVVVKD